MPISKKIAALEMKTGAENTADYLNQIKFKNVGLVVNQTSVIGKIHLVDSLLKLGINIVTIFSPEHGFTGNADAGEHVKDGKYKGINVISLYGDHRKPNGDQLQNMDIIVFDIQDVGVRFYTYISSLHYVMEACAEFNKPLLVLDRPNPHAHYIDGPILQDGFTSFIGMHQVPVVYGMTMGEYAQMINGESWLKNKNKCNLQVIKCTNYNRSNRYDLPVKPSPNLPNALAVQLYPSICFFEGTTLSLGRGTNKQFQVIGHPALKSDFTFTPKPNEGAKDPFLNGIKCFGVDLSNQDVDQIYNERKLNLNYLYTYYHQLIDKKEKFFLDNLFFDKLAGTDVLRKQIIAGNSLSEIRKSWQKGLHEFDKIRKKYLIYD